LKANHNIGRGSIKEKYTLFERLKNLLRDLIITLFFTFSVAKDAGGKLSVSDDRFLIEDLIGHVTGDHKKILS
jgi:hypothetical protein